MIKLNIDYFSYLEVEKIGLGVFSPLTGFMSEKDFYSVAENMKLSSGLIFPLPVVLPIPEDKIIEITKANKVSLIYNSIEVAILYPNSIYKPDFYKVLPHIFGTKDDRHPGFIMLQSLGNTFVGGEINFKQRVKNNLSNYDLSPKDVKALIKKKKLTTVAGFQTRNVPHRAHEYLQRIALEKVDQASLELDRKVIQAKSDSVVAYGKNQANMILKQNLSPEVLKWKLIVSWTTSPKPCSAKIYWAFPHMSH